MELDNIKRNWQNTSIKPVLEEDQIRRMVSNISGSAYSNLLKYEKIGIFVFLLCLGVFFVFKEPFLRCFYLTSGLFGIFWQIYKYRYLKQIDLLNDNIIDVASKITMYKKYLGREIVIGIVWAFLFFALYIYTLLFDPTKFVFYNPDKIRWGVIAYVIAVTFVISFGLLFYKLMYRDNIRILEKSLKEIEEFKKDNV